MKFKLVGRGVFVFLDVFRVTRSLFVEFFIFLCRVGFVLLRSGVKFIGR